MPDSRDIRRKKKVKDKIEDTLKSYDYDFTHIQFNFSFITSSNDRDLNSLDKTQKAMLSDRLFDLSNEPFKKIMQRGKERGFEAIKMEDMKVKCACNPEFYKDEYRSRNSPDKYWITRLHSNNQYSDCRIIGKIIDQVFYVMFFYEGHECYK